MSTSFQSTRPVIVDSELPAQTEATNGKALISNGSTASWNTILGMIGTNAGQTPPAAVVNAILPAQAGNNGKVLATDGANVSWQNSVAQVPYDITNFINGTLMSNEMVMRVVVTRSFSVPANFADSRAVATNVGSAAAVFAIRKNGVQIATLTYAAGSPTGAFSASPAITFNVGDQLSITAPAAPDATLGSIAITVAAIRLL